LIGVRAGQPLSGESKLPDAAHAVTVAEGNTTWRDNASASPTRRRQRPWHVRTPSAREPGDLYHRPGRMPLRGPHWEGTRRSR
jgi:hypothetical protein